MESEIAVLAGKCAVENIVWAHQVDDEQDEQDIQDEQDARSGRMPLPPGIRMEG